MKKIIFVATDKGLFRIDKGRVYQENNQSLKQLSARDHQLYFVNGNQEIWKYGPHSGDLLLQCDEEVTALLPIQNKLFFGTSKVNLYTLTESKLDRVSSLEGAPGRERWYTPWGGPPSIRSMAASKSGEIFINIHVGGILKSNYTLNKWEQLVDIEKDVHQVNTCMEFILAATAYGLGISSDGGQTWSYDSKGLHAHYCRAVATDGVWSYLTASLGPAGEKAAIYRRKLDAPGTLEKCHNGLPEWFEGNINTHNLVSTHRYTAFATKDNKLFISENSGNSWELIWHPGFKIRGLEMINDE